MCIRDRLAELVQRYNPVSVVVDPWSAAGELILALDAARIEVVRPTARDVAAAAGALYDATRPDADRIRHLGQTPLNAAVAGAVKRPLADAWTWNRRGSVCITPLVACSLAAWGHACAPGGRLFVAAGYVGARRGGLPAPVTRPRPSSVALPQRCPNRSPDRPPGMCADRYTCFG